MTEEKRVPHIFIVCGEHSGDALGARLMRAIRQRRGSDVRFSGVGGQEMADEGLLSLYPMSDVAVMGIKAIARSLPLIYRRVHQTVDAVVAAKPDILVIIDSPEFTHPIARRVRNRSPHTKIVNYVSPSVWAWRPGRAARMRRYIDLVLALLPFEPAAHQRLGGPACVYVGHPLAERIDEIRAGDPGELATRLGIAAGKPVLLVLPGSRRSEVSLLIDAFGDTVARVKATHADLEVIIPTVSHLADMVRQRSSQWAVSPHYVTSSADKYMAMKLADAALAASGTVTLELAIAGTPSVVAYMVDRIMLSVRFLLKVESIVLANLVLGRNVYPECLQERCSADVMAPKLIDLMADTTARADQLAALSEIPDKLKITAESPSLAAADAVLAVLDAQGCQPTM